MSVLSSIQGIREEIALHLNEAESDNSDIYTNWVNQGLKDIFISFPINPYYLTSADRTLSSGTRIYAAPSNFERMDSIVYPADERTLTYIPPEQFDMLHPSASDAGGPSIYTIRGQGATAQLEYHESPNSSLTLHYNYFRLPATVSAGSASPDLPAKYSDLLILYGIKIGLRRRGKYAESTQIAAEYEVLKERMKQELLDQTNEIQSIKSVRDFQKAGSYSDPIKNLYWSDTT